MSVELFSENIYPESTLAELFSGNSSNRSVGGIIEGTNIKSSAGSGGVAILPSENTNIGLYVYDDDGNTVFNTLIDGDNVGDVYIGDFANNQGIWYDKSAGASGTVYIKGNVYIGGTTVFESGYDPSGKANVFRQDTEPASGMVEKDIWIDTNNGDKPYSYNGSAWIAQYTIIDGGSISTGTIDADLVTVSNLSATNITAGTLSVDRISAGSIVSSKVGTDLTDSNISSINFNNITATNVVANSVSANDITAGTMTGSTVRTDTGGAGHYKRVEMSNSDNSLKFYNSDNVLTGSIYGNVTSSDLLWINADTLWIQAPTIINDTLGVGGVTAGTIVPNSTTGSYDLGDSTHKWGELHCKDFFTTSNEANWTGDIVPTTDNLYELGLSTSTRWYKLWSHYTAVGDLLMANGFRINEESEDAIAIYNQKDEKIFILDEDGDLWIKGKVRSNTDMKKDFPFNLKVYTKKELKNKEDEKTDWKTNTKMSITKKNLLKVTKK